MSTGHAFGLPHTDENYYNFDRGDCLDYTNRPRNNLEPGTNASVVRVLIMWYEWHSHKLLNYSTILLGEFNFNLLYSLYGSANGDTTTSTSETRDRNVSNSNARPITAPTNVEEEEEDDEDDRRLEAPVDAKEETSDVIMEKYYSVAACLETKACSECMDEAFFDYGGARHRMLHESEQGEACEFDLGEGYTIQSHKLLVN